MDDKSRLQLDKLIKEYGTEETTDKIRSLKHSKLIRDDITKMQQLKSTHSRTRGCSPEMFKQMCVNQCSFLYNNYTNIFNKLMKDEIDLSIMQKFLEVLYNIEEGVIDQHEGSYKVGMILKELYIDSALKNEKNNEKRDLKRNKKDKNAKTTNTTKTKNIKWSEYKMLHTMD